MKYYVPTWKLCPKHIVIKQIVLNKLTFADHVFFAVIIPCSNINLNPSPNPNPNPNQHFICHVLTLMD